MHRISLPLPGCSSGLAARPCWICLQIPGARTVDQLWKVHSALESPLLWSQDLRAHLGSAFPSDNLFRLLIQVVWMQCCISLLLHTSRMLLPGQKCFPVNHRIIYFWPLFVISQTSCFWNSSPLVNSAVSFLIKDPHCLITLNFTLENRLAWDNNHHLCLKKGQKLSFNDMMDTRYDDFTLWRQRANKCCGWNLQSETKLHLRPSIYHGIGEERRRNSKSSTTLNFLHLSNYTKVLALFLTSVQFQC